MDLLVFNDNAGAISRGGVTGDDLLRRFYERGIAARLCHDDLQPETLDQLGADGGTVIVAGTASISGCVFILTLQYWECKWTYTCSGCDWQQPSPSSP